MILNHFDESVSSPEKAGVGGSIPSLATIFSITYRPSKSPRASFIPFHSNIFGLPRHASGMTLASRSYRSVSLISASTFRATGVRSSLPRGSAKNCTNGHQAHALYCSGKVPNGRLDVPIISALYGSSYPCTSPSGSSLRTRINSSSWSPAPNRGLTSSTQGRFDDADRLFLCATAGCDGGSREPFYSIFRRWPIAFRPCRLCNMRWSM